MKEVLANDLLELGKEIFELREQCEAIQATLKAPQEKLEALKAKMQANFEALEMDKVHIKGFGTISTVTKMSVKVPQGEMRDEFFDNLPPEDYKALRTVNSNSLNSWYNEKMAEAVEAGKYDFKIVGIEEPKAYKTLVMRKA